MEQNIFQKSDNWLKKHGPRQHVVVSSRVRLARNIMRIPFAAHAQSDELEDVFRTVNRIIRQNPRFRDYQVIPLNETPVRARTFLKESRIISPEMVKGAEFRAVYVNPDFHISLMINEEDHVRIQGLTAGLNVRSISEEIFQIDDELNEKLPVAFSDQFGYLTACPTNLGTGLRVSVMLHLPGLALTKKIQDVLTMIQPRGQTVRGFYGENSEYDGDFYQVSNEISLGKTEEKIIEDHEKVIDSIIIREEEAREELFSNQPDTVEDAIWRSYGVLSQARLIDVKEAMNLLSRIRLGIHRGYFKTINHEKLNQMIIDIQPAHLELFELNRSAGSKKNEIARATLLRNSFNILGSEN